MDWILTVPHYHSGALSCRATPLALLPGYARTTGHSQLLVRWRHSALLLTALAAAVRHHPTDAVSSDCRTDGSSSICDAVTRCCSHPRTCQLRWQSRAIIRYFPKRAHRCRGTRCIAPIESAPDRLFSLLICYRLYVSWHCTVSSNIYFSGFAARQTHSATRSSILSCQHIHRRWDSHVVAVGRATRLHELDMGLWLDLSFTVRYTQSDWSAWRQCCCFSPTSCGHWMWHSPWHYCSAGKHCTVIKLSHCNALLKSLNKP